MCVSVCLHSTVCSSECYGSASDLWLVVFSSHILCCLTIKGTVKRPHKIGKTEVLKDTNSLMKVESIAESSLGAFFNTYGLH